MITLPMSTKSKYQSGHGQGHVANWLITVLILISGACAYDPVYYGPPPYPEFQPHYYDYYFYPSASVYFQFSSGNYYYRDRGVWVRSRALPPNIQIDAKDRVRIRVDDNKPNIKYEDHLRQYKPRPDYRSNQDRSIKERDANRRWYEEYQQKQVPPNKKDADRKKRLN